MSDREIDATNHEGKGWMVNTHEVDRGLSSGSLHRLVRRVTATRPRSSASSANLTTRPPDRGPYGRPRPPLPGAPPGPADPAAPGPTLGPSRGARFSSCRPRR